MRQENKTYRSVRAALFIRAPHNAWIRSASAAVYEEKCACVCVWLLKKCVVFLQKVLSLLVRATMPAFTEQSNSVITYMCVRLEAFPTVCAFFRVR